MRVGTCFAPSGRRLTATACGAPRPALARRLEPSWGRLSSGRFHLAFQKKEGVLLGLLCFYFSRLARKLECDFCWKTDSGLQGKGEFTTRRGETGEGHFFQIRRQLRRASKGTNCSCPPLDTPETPR